MPDWEENSSQLSDNLKTLLSELNTEASNRHPLNSDQARYWHRKVMFGLKPDNILLVGNFRGEKGLENEGVTIGGYNGTHPNNVAHELEIFDAQFQRIISKLDQEIDLDADLSDEDVGNILDVCSWVHGEWVRIHPFANGNGRISRMWVNVIAMRYGLPPFCRLRPRPDGYYSLAAMSAMTGDYYIMTPVFIDMLKSLYE